MKLKALLLLSVLLTGIASVSAQNLVPNPSFELFNNCPTSLSGIAYSPSYTLFPTVKDWINPVEQGSPDYFNVCSGTAGVKTPDCIFGYQQAYTGTAYSGLIAWEGHYTGSTLTVDYREYLQTRLSQQLIAGHNYCISFYVSPTISAVYDFNYVSINDFGLNLSPTQTSVPNGNGYQINLPYTISNAPNAQLTDTSKWYKIRGFYKATGGEQWLTIGCFNTHAPASTIVHASSTNSNISRSYLYIDEVSVTEITSADTIRTAHDTTICDLKGFSYTATATAGESYLWNTGASAASISIHDTGLYWCKTINECMYYEDTFRIGFQQYHPLSLGSDSINCQNMPIQLKPTSHYNHYLWSTGSTDSVISATTSGHYILSVTDFCGTQKDTISVTIQPPTPAPIVSDTTVCQNTVSPKLNVSGSNLTWYNYEADLYGNASQPYISTTYFGEQKIYVTQKIGLCESAKVPVIINVKYKPVADIGNYFSLCQDDTTHIGKEYPDVKYAWSTGDNTCCIRPDHTGNYTFSIYNDCGISRDSVYVDISPCDDCIAIPNAFTPNNDGKNDQFKVIVKCPVSRYSLRIFNKWGEMIFASTNPDEAWKGFSHGLIADAGVYVYSLEYISQNSGYRHFLKGNISLLR